MRRNLQISHDNEDWARWVRDLAARRQSDVTTLIVQLLAEAGAQQDGLRPMPPRLTPKD